MSKGGTAFFVSLGISAVVASGGCSSNKNSLVADAGTVTGSCSTPPKVEPTTEKDCASCTATSACANATPVESCCTWAGEPRTPLARATNLHRYSAPAGQTAVDVSCLGSAAGLGTPQTVTLTGYVWLFSSGVDSAGVKVEVFKENNPNTDGSIQSTPVGTYTTKSTDMADPIDTSWSSKCPSGCSFRQYTISGLQTETPYVIKTSDASGGSLWATLYDYNIYFSNASVQGGMATCNATAAAADDLGTVAGSVGLSISGTQGLLAGEVHDCGDVRISGATVGTTVPPEGQLYYSTSDEGNPLFSGTAEYTSQLGLFGGINVAPGKPVRVTALGQDPSSAGKFLMLGTYVVQVYPGAVTAVSLRGRRPWQL